MERSKKYWEGRCSKSGLQRVIRLYRNLHGINGDAAAHTLVTTTYQDGDWTWDNYDQFWAAFEGCREFHVSDHDLSVGEQSNIHGDRFSDLRVKSQSREHIDLVFSEFERHIKYQRPADDPIKVFVAHGRSVQWRDLKEHLSELHGIQVIAFESGPRGGFMINDVVASMVQGASIALLVLTAEDLGADGTERARENVIYETGYCQARLGLRRAIILREEGTNAFTNTDGIVEIRFPKGHIRATFGDVVATIDREFPSRRRPK